MLETVVLVDCFFVPEYKDKPGRIQLLRSTKYYTNSIPWRQKHELHSSTTPLQSRENVAQCSSHLAPPLRLKPARRVSRLISKIRSALDQIPIIRDLTRRPPDFDTLDNTIPPVGRHNHAPSILPGGGRLIQTASTLAEEYKKAILFVRDVRDIVLSDYAWDECLDLTKYLDIRDLDDYLLPWLMGKTQTPAGGSWQDNLRSWLDSPLATNGGLLVIRYEDMRRNTEEAFVSMVEFLGVPVRRAAIKDAVSNNSLDRMRAKEDASTKYNPRN